MQSSQGGAERIENEEAGGVGSPTGLVGSNERKTMATTTDAATNTRGHHKTVEIESRDDDGGMREVSGGSRVGWLVLESW